MPSIAGAALKNFIKLLIDVLDMLVFLNSPIPEALVSHSQIGTPGPVEGDGPKRQYSFDVLKLPGSL
jgi:hypothetical protein